MTFEGVQFTPYQSEIILAQSVYPRYKSGIHVHFVPRASYQRWEESNFQRQRNCPSVEHESICINRVGMRRYVWHKEISDPIMATFAKICSFQGEFAEVGGSKTFDEILFNATSG